MTIVPFVPQVDSSDKKDKMSFYVKTVPDDPNSDQAKVYVMQFDLGGPEDVLHFVDEFYNLMEMKRLLENGPALFQHARLLLQGDAREKFAEHRNDLLGNAPTEEDETPENFRAVLDLLLRSILPVRAGEKIKKELCKVKKPMMMTVTNFVARLRKLNKFITYCPGDVPELRSDELQVILEQAVPSGWRSDLLKLHYT